MIRLEHVSRLYAVGDQVVHALDDVNLVIEPGEYLSVMGPSGSGKSTLLHLLGLLDRPDRGRYLFHGEDTARLDDRHLARLRRRHIGFVFQFFHLVPRLSAAGNVELPMMLDGWPLPRRRARVRRLLEAVGLADRARHRPDQLSGGQRQRVAIARALALDPELVLADEPTGNLDQAAGHEILDLLEAVVAQGRTLVLVTHDPELGHRAPRRLQMRDGRLFESPGGVG
ncbi:MAG: ABC transporter ATP-binding protein [Gammaproteobacteria bacterium]|nr:MAG: ABC transporter ATP-binding protein [Gammaproteobacteria bacterium]